MNEQQERIWALEARFSIDGTEPDDRLVAYDRPIDYKDAVTAYQFLSTHHFLKGNSTVARSYHVLAEIFYEEWYLKEVAETKGKLDSRTEQEMLRLRTMIDRVAETRGYKEKKKKRTPYTPVPEAN